MIIKKYSQLKEYINAYRDGYISLLVCRSSGGLAKSHLLREALKGEDHQKFTGHSTPLSIYMTLMKNPDDLVVFDDVDSLIDNKSNVALLKQYCEIEEDKQIRYSTTARLKDEEIKPRYTSNNKVCLLCNDFKRIGKNIKALLTRGIYIDFQPSNEEILSVLKANFKKLDLEIYDYLVKHSLEINDLNFRTYLKCVELKQAKINWKEYLQKENGLDYLEEFALQIADMPKRERSEMWHNETGKSERTFQRILKKSKKR